MPYLVLFGSMQYVNLTKSLLTLWILTMYIRPLEFSEWILVSAIHNDLQSLLWVAVCEFSETQIELW